MQKMYDFLGAFTKGHITSEEITNFFSIFGDSPRRSDDANRQIERLRIKLVNYLRKHIGQFGAIVLPDTETRAAMNKVVAVFNEVKGDTKDRMKKDAFLASGILWAIENPDILAILKPKLRLDTPDVTKKKPRIGSEISNEPETPAKNSTSAFERPKSTGKTMNSFVRATEPPKPFKTKKGYTGRWRS